MDWAPESKRPKIPDLSARFGSSRMAARERETSSGSREPLLLASRVFSAEGSFEGQWIGGEPPPTIPAGRLTTVLPSRVMTKLPSPVISPITAQSSFHLSAMEPISPRSSSFTMRSILSWVSERAVSQGSILSLRGTRSTLTSIPVLLLEAISLEDETIPAAPMSCMATIRPFEWISRQPSISLFSRRGSPFGTRGRLGAAVPINSEEAKAAPATPSLPVLEPIRTAMCPGFAVLELTMPPSGTSPRHIALTRGLKSKH